MSANDENLVWSDELGDMRKNKSSKNSIDISLVDEDKLELKIRRLTSGKGRTIIEITGLPNNKKWCQKLAKDLKKTLGVGGAFKGSSEKLKDQYIEIHGEKIEKVMELLNAKSLKWKKIGG